ncbi:hypothetical protein AJ88_37380 [Mesorhizobium amorphae CCBAU 01583]|nr:hypothetical protein AJ88_37380 [Mesorhizobium amorphae CCBAU 01583]
MLARCRAAGTGGGTANKDISAKAVEADSMTDPAKSAERNKIWSAIYDKIMADAPWAPVFDEQRFTIESARMGGADDLYVHPCMFSSTTIMCK